MTKLLLLLSLFLVSCSKFDVGACYGRKDRHLGKTNLVYKVYTKQSDKAYMLARYEYEESDFSILTTEDDYWADRYNKIACEENFIPYESKVGELQNICRDAKKLGLDFDKNICDNEVKFNYQQE